MNSYVGTPEQLSQYLWQLDKDKKYEIKEYSKKRSTDANALAWELMTQIGNVLRKSKEEVYLQMLKDYGQQEMVSILSSINPSGYLKYYEVAGTSTLNGKEFTHYRVFKGTSQYTNKEMSIFIDGIKQEAEQLGIETRTPEEIDRIKRMWKND